MDRYEEAFYAEERKRNRSDGTGINSAIGQTVQASTAQSSLSYGLTSLTPTKKRWLCTCTICQKQSSNG